ncbi:DUF4432 family protein [Devosia sp. ZB163]|uniref:DUF4432 family protein n=1 Tax=Devosia sp. ZB163 TaxID=3025938 RepID=UPI002362B6B2|nr:DUF4432 family protein [Devosia sp. ZB163]MDC9824578.1 DUF4432 family protein [Devosia sp. ZB163]
MTIGASRTVIDLGAVAFEARERQLAELGALRASVFRYASGVAAVRIANADGEIVVLPYHGQQIWDATFYGRRLTMRSVFDEPVASTEFLRNYGAFLVHCGASAMGNVGPNDKHAPHGELPNAAYEAARLVLGSDDAGAYVEVSGKHVQRVAFGLHYEFEPVLRVRERGGRIELDLTVTNRRSKPMELMYLAHVNFRPVDGARLVDAVPNTPEHFRVRTHMPGYRLADQSYHDLMARFQDDPASHRTIVAGRRIDPELVAGMDYPAGADGWAHTLQLLPDGTADFISHRPSELDKGVRWMSRNGDEDALGPFLPATAEADGREAELAKGNVKFIAPGGTFRTRLAFGALTTDEAATMAGEIAALAR